MRGARVEYAAPGWNVLVVLCLCEMTRGVSGQGPVFTAIDLSDIALALDEKV